MPYPRRTISNPLRIEGRQQECSWKPTQKSTSHIDAQISDNDEIIKLSITESRNDKYYTQRTSVTLGRDEALELLKVLSGLI